MLKRLLGTLLWRNSHFIMRISNYKKKNYTPQALLCQACFIWIFNIYFIPYTIYFNIYCILFCYSSISLFKNACMFFWFCFLEFFSSTLNLNNFLQALLRTIYICFGPLCQDDTITRKKIVPDRQDSSFGKARSRFWKTSRLSGIGIIFTCNESEIPLLMGNTSQTGSHLSI